MSALQHLNQDREFIRDDSVRLHNENERFRHYLLHISSSELDKCFTLASRSVTPRIDCTACAACCRRLEPELSRHEFDSLGGRTDGQNAPGFLSVKEPGGDSEHYFLSSPCRFLEANRCSIYEKRPSACSSYPHLEQSGIRFRLRTVFAQSSRCPIVFHAIEQLKLITGFKSAES
jgi:Fe-S-cluster containining protein